MTRYSKEGFISTYFPHSLLSNENVYIWLEDRLGEPGERYFWTDTMAGHYLYLKAEDLLAFKLAFKV